MNAITKSFTGQKRIRKSFGRIPEVAPMPNLIDVQRSSYEAFLQMNVQPDSRTQTGLQEVFKSVFPIDDFAGRGRLEFVHYELEEPKYDVEECIQRGMTFAAPLKVILRLIVWDLDEDTGARSIRDIKEQPVYMGDMPLMTDNGTFIINGTERVIVSQMHRSPGVFFDHDKGKTHSQRQVSVRRAGDPVSRLLARFRVRQQGPRLRADRPQAEAAGDDAAVCAGEHGDRGDAGRARARRRDGRHRRDPRHGCRGDPRLLLRPGHVHAHAEGLGAAVRVRELSRHHAGRAAGRRRYRRGGGRGRRQADRSAPRARSPRTPRPCWWAAPTCWAATWRSTWSTRRPARSTPRPARSWPRRGWPRSRTWVSTGLPTLAVDQANGPWLRNTLAVDKNGNRDDALVDIYRVMRPGEPPTPETAEALFRGLFFDGDRYDLSAVGRVKMNMRLGIDVPDTVRVLRKDDILRTVKIMCELKDGRGTIDDIDNLGNRRVRSVGELMENQYRLGLLRMERAIRERMGSVDIDTVMPHDLINAKPAAAAVREFFGSSQLSQFMDQTNPLSEVTHKRRLSALGPGGLTRERAGFEVRDVHPTHYGRICPIETPEGPNIGLINSLATYAKVNKYGFIETPYRLVKDGQVQDGWKYLSAMEEEKLSSPRPMRRPTSDGQFHQRAGVGAAAGRFPPGQARGRDRGRRKPEAAGLGGRGADPVPRERRREPGADGLQHAAPGGAADPFATRRWSAPAWRRR